MRNAENNLSGKRIVLGLSGGVDSAVAAILLRERGADVHALHMTNWEDDDGYCTAAADLQDARQVCEQLDVPFHSINFSTEYREQVFTYFLEEYAAGRTPNPDVLCNREIKFGVFRDYALRLGADMIATGHYARTGKADGHTVLLKAADGNKDQSYFLHAVCESALAATLFPLGDLQKSEVREIARAHGLNVYEKKDSTGICFIGERPFRDFLSTYLPANPGAMETPEGEVVGEHNGLMYYTLGQRQGLGIGGRTGASDEPWYVAAKDVDRNRLIVVQGEHPLRFSDALEATDVNWINAEPAALQEGGSLRCHAKIRYRQPDQACRISSAHGNLRIDFDAPQADVTPGQFAVIYDADRCLGGAVIDQAIRRDQVLLKTG